MSGTNILLLLIDFDFHREGGFWKMFGDEAYVKARPLGEVALVDCSDEGRFDMDEGCLV